MNGEYYGYLNGFEYNIGEKLFKFITMDYDDIDKLKELYSELIQVVADGKLNNKEYYLYCDINNILQKCLDFSPYTHFYNQILVDTIIKTYNMNFIRSDLLIKNDIKFNYNEGFNKKETSIHELLLEKDEDKKNTTILVRDCFQKISGITEKRNNKFLEFFNEVKDALSMDFKEKVNEYNERITLMAEYSKDKLIRDLTPEQKIYLYESTGVFNLSYLNLSPTNAIFLDTAFKTKYIANGSLTKEEKRLDVLEIAKKIKEKNIEVQEIYELDNSEDQIRFELFKVIQNNFIIKKCTNCGKLFIPLKTDKQYCDNLYLNTEKTCSEIGATTKHKEKISNSLILKEFQREYKRMYGLHYNNSKKFTEAKFKMWSKQARELRDKYTDDKIEDFKEELQKLSKIFYDFDKI